MAQDDTQLSTYHLDENSQEKLISECVEHEHTSFTWLQTTRNDWDSKESMLIGSRPEDKLSKQAKSKIFNPILATQLIERSGRVMSQTPMGEAFAVSKDDVGKNILMNLLLKYYQNTAIEEGSHLLKLRQMDVYSGVYGSMFGLVPWRVNRMTGFVGPELLPLNMRSVRPQPFRRTIDKMDWFTVKSNVSIEWLKAQDPTYWMNVDKLAADLKERQDGGDSGRMQNNEDKTYFERKMYPSPAGDKRFPSVDLFTEYRQDQWITWTPQIVDSKTSRPYILRVVKNPYPKGYLPIVVKHAFPLMDSIIGLGDFERGKSLQYAMNSLINLYMDGVKYSIFPPLHINLEGVDPQSIRWGAGEKWYMQRPNEDVQIMNMKSTDWLSTFNSTYGFLSQAITNLAGSTQVQDAEGTSPALGKTPGAIKQYGLSQTARDEWDRFMMEDTIKQTYERWICLTTEKLDVPIVMRIFGSELQDIKKVYQDEPILEIFKSNNRGNLAIDKSYLNDDHVLDENGDLVEGEDYTKYDFEIETGSTMQKTTADEGEAASQMIKDFQDAPWLLQEIREKGDDINFAELLKRRMIGEGVKDWDKILVKLKPGSINPATGQPYEQPATDEQNAEDTIPGQENLSPEELMAAAQQGGQPSGAPAQNGQPPAVQPPPQQPVQQAAPTVPPTGEAPDFSGAALTLPDGSGIKDQEIAQAIQNLQNGQQ